MFTIVGLCFRWAAEQAKARELGDVVDFVRDLNLEAEKEHHVTAEPSG